MTVSRRLLKLFLCGVGSLYSIGLLAESKSFTIGMAVCLTGECAADGDSAVKGAQLAAAEINATGGVLGHTIEFKIQDSADAVSGAKAMTAYQQLRLDRSIHYFIGPSWTPGGLALAPRVARESEVIMSSPSLGVADFHRAGANIFNFRGVDEAASRAMARLAIERGWKRAAIFSSQQPWELVQGKVFEEEFVKAGGVITEKVEPLPTQTALSSEAQKIIRSKPEVIFLSSVVQLGLATRELKKLGWRGPQLAAFIDDTRIKEAAGALEEVLVMTFSVPSTEFAQKYAKRFQAQPEVPAGASYDIVLAYAKAIEQAGTFDTAVVSQALHKVKFQGASGEVAVDAEGCVQRQVGLWRVEGGKLVTTSAEELAT